MAAISYDITEDYIELCQLLKTTGLCKSGGEAKYVISEGLVSVNGLVETRKKCKIRGKQTITYNGETILTQQER